MSITTIDKQVNSLVLEVGTILVAINNHTWQLSKYWLGIIQ